MSATSINQQTDASINGRMFAQTEVTLQMNAITEPADDAIVPDVVGETELDATDMIINAGLTVGIIDYVCDDLIPADEVIGQNPMGGTIALSGSAVDIEVSTGPCEVEGEGEPAEGEGEPAEGEGEPAEGEGEGQTVQVPNIGAMTEEEARDTLEALGFVVGIEYDCPRGCNRPPAGTILDQNPPSGTNAPAGSLVTITVSNCRPSTGLLNMGALGDILAAVFAFFGLLMFWCLDDCTSAPYINK